MISVSFFQAAQLWPNPADSPVTALFAGEWLKTAKRFRPVRNFFRQDGLYAYNQALSESIRKTGIYSIK